MIVLGVDPGLAGAVVALRDGKIGECIDMPAVQVRQKGKELNLPALVQAVAEIGGPVEAAWIEAVHAMPKQGVSSSFKFGRCYGEVRGVIAGRQIPIRPITPQAWKKAMRVGQGKDAARALASQEFPQSAHLFAPLKDERPDLFSPEAAE